MAKSYNGTDPQVRERAEILYRQGLPDEEIAKICDVRPGTIRQWRRRYEWNKVEAAEIIPAAVTRLEPEVTDHRFVTALEKLEPLLDVEDVLGRHKKTTKALQSVVVVIAQECQRRAGLYRANPERADRDGLAKLTQAAINMNSQCLQQEIYIHQTVAERASRIVQHMSPEELEGMS